MNCATALCVSCCGRNIGEFNVSETQLPLPSLPAEGAASDLVLVNISLQIASFCLIPTLTSICPHAGVIIPHIFILVLPCR